ncbi:glycosyltransferase [Mycobacterium sp. M23085]|uniref:glycosyltransferase n=1 Tax=Mycobacterium sp. M23085 TaxID=3378087 RepID=UPI003877EE37
MTRDTDRAYLKRPVGGAATLPVVRPLAVLIVTGEDRGRLETCLDSVAQHLPGLPVYVYGSAELATKFPAVHWVSGPPGVGSAAAFNALAEHAPSDADLLLLTSDTRLLGRLPRTRKLLRQSQVAAVSPMVRDDTAPGRKPWDVASRRRTLIRELSTAAGASESRRGGPISRLYARQPSETEGIDGDVGGGCLAINRLAWNSVGGFDEEFFHAEAADWQARARMAGWRILLADELGAQRAPIAGKVAADYRDRDVARADTALLLEHQHSVHHADLYLACTTALGKLRPSNRAGRLIDRPSIVIATNRLVYGGAERQKALLATELDRRGYSVTIVCVQRFGPLLAEIPDTVRVVRQPWWAPAVDIAKGPAVLITGDTNTEVGFGTLWRAAGKDRRWLVAPHVPPEEDRPIYSRPLTAAMRRADGFIVLAQRHWDMLAAQHRLWGQRFVAPNGVAETSEPSPRVRPSGEPVHLVMLSRIVEHKNPHLLIEALGGLAELPWRLSIFGDGPDRERLQGTTPARLRDRVQWCGWSAGPGPALKDADLLCVPSRSEAFPLVILEAMARAVPVAASAICAVPEMLDFGRAGFLVESVSVSGWREQLCRILAEPAALPMVGRRGHERMRKHYTVGAMTDAYLDAIGAVM